MTLFEILKQLKKIEPDAAFKENSKRAIFALEPAPVRGGRVRSTIFKIFETAAAVALTGFFVMLLTGAFSGGEFAPQYAAVNPDALRAEAQAIDIQIQLANLNYVAPAAQSTVSAPVAAPQSAPSANATATAPESAAPAGAATSTATTTITIDQALQGLAQ